MPYPSFRHALAPIAVLAATGLAAIGHAADTGGKFSIRGMGSQSCGAYLATTARPDDFARSASWLLGYVTARNRLENGTYDIVPTETAVDFPNIVAVICRNNNAATLETAANDAITVMLPMRQTLASPLVQVQADGKSVAIHQEAVRRLQTALIAKKFFQGAADGASSPQFVAALKDFQKKEAIAVTGLPDIDTFIRAIIKR